MKRWAFIVLIFLYSCGKKGYNDYDEKDFVEDQGIITKISRTRNPFDNAWKIDIKYAYNLSSDTISFGEERELDLMLQLGQPIVILVHKSDNKINFYGRRGVINEQFLEIGYKRLFEKEIN